MTTTLNSESAVHATFNPGDRVRVIDPEGYPALYWGVEGTVLPNTRTCGHLVKVQFDHRADGRDGDLQVLPERIRKIETADEVLDRLVATICDVQVSLALECLQPLDSLDLLAIRAQASGLECVLMMIEDFHG